jgi:hypothetical protein
VIGRSAFWGAIALPLVLAGCNDGQAVIPSLISAGPVTNGQVTFTGHPGALRGNPYGVTITIVREGGYLAKYTTQHLGSGSLPIISGFALANPDGSFPATTLGDSVNAVRSGDEANFQAIIRTTVPGSSVQIGDAGPLAYFPLK